MNVETCVISESSIYLWHESHKEFGAKFIVIISVTADSSLLSPTGWCEENIGMTMINGYVKVCITTSTPSTLSLRPLWTM